MLQVLPIISPFSLNGWQVCLFSRDATHKNATNCHIEKLLSNLFAHAREKNVKHITVVMDDNELNFFFIWFHFVWGANFIVLII